MKKIDREIQSLMCEIKPSYLDDSNHGTHAFSTKLILDQIKEILDRKVDSIDFQN